MSESNNSPDAAPTTEPAATSDKPSFARGILDGIKDVGTPLFSFVEVLGAYVTLFAKAVSWLPRRPWRIKNYVEAAHYIGVGSLPIVLLVGAFTGAVTSLQSVKTFEQFFGSGELAGATTGVALAIELAPVLTALMLSGRVASGIATELGTMRISEQIDALESMAVNPVQFLVLPRLVVGFLLGPILTLLFFIVGMVGAYIVAVVKEGVDPGLHTQNIIELLRFASVAQGLIKGALFGVVVVLIGCYEGFSASGGGRGVGLATSRAVVRASVAVLILDYFATEVLFVLLPTTDEVII